MHPPSFSVHQRLSDWPECRLELRCCGCRGRSIDYPVKMLIAERGDQTFHALLGKLRCQQCGKPPAPVFLLAGFSRTFNGGSTPDWAVQLVPERRV